MASELSVLQYRTTYTNGTPISGSKITNTTSYKSRLSLTKVAVLNSDSESGNTLKFTSGDRYTIWPGMLANV